MKAKLVTLVTTRRRHKLDYDSFADKDSTSQHRIVVTSCGLKVFEHPFYPLQLRKPRASDRWCLTCFGKKPRQP